MLARPVTKGVNIRTSEDSRTNAYILGQLALGEQIELVEPHADAPKWWKVKWKGQAACVLDCNTAPAG